MAGKSGKAGKRDEEGGIYRANAAPNDASRASQQQLGSHRNSNTIDTAASASGRSDRAHDDRSTNQRHNEHATASATARLGECVYGWMLRLSRAHLALLEPLARCPSSWVGVLGALIYWASSSLLTTSLLYCYIF